MQKEEERTNRSEQIDTIQASVKARHVSTKSAVHLLTLGVCKAITATVRSQPTDRNSGGTNVIYSTGQPSTDCSRPLCLSVCLSVCVLTLCLCLSLSLAFYRLQETLCLSVSVSLSLWLCLSVSVSVSLLSLSLSDITVLVDWA